MSEDDVDYNGGKKKPDGNGSIIRKVAEAAGSAFGPQGWLLQFIQLPATVIIAGMCVYIVLILGPQFYHDQMAQEDTNRNLFREEIRETRSQFRDEIQATRAQQEVIRKWDEQREEARRKWDDLRWQATNDMIRDNHRATMEVQKSSEGRWEVARQILDRIVKQQGVIVKSIDRLGAELKKLRTPATDRPKELPPGAGSGVGVGLTAVAYMPYAKG